MSTRQGVPECAARAAETNERMSKRARAPDMFTLDDRYDKVMEKESGESGRPEGVDRVCILRCESVRSRCLQEGSWITLATFSSIFAEGVQSVVPAITTGHYCGQFGVFTVAPN